MKTLQTTFFSAGVFLLTLLVTVGVVYSPTWLAYFNADDFSFLHFLYFNYTALLNGQRWEEWLVGGIVNYAVFRPIGNLFWFLNWSAFGFDAPGYHLVTTLFHFIATLAVLYASHRLTRHRMTAGIAAVLFAILPVHAEAVSWVAANYDVLSGMFFFLALIFYILYRERRRWRFYLLALGMFALGLGSKETSLTLPAILALYDVLYHPRLWFQPRRTVLLYLPFVLIFAMRFIFFGHGYRGFVFAPEGWLYYVDTNLWRVFDPVFEYLPVRWAALTCIVVLLAVYRWRAPVIFALAWIPITLVPTLVGGVSDRSFYIPSFAVTLLLAIVFASLLRAKPMLVRFASVSALVALLALYGVTLFTRNQAYARASYTAQTILQRVQELQPTLPHAARLVFVGVPSFVPEGAPVFGAGFWEALQLVYRDPSLRVYKFAQFPIWLDELDHTWFFQVDHRRVTERSDLREMLKARASCASTSRVALAWDFARDAQNWEAWNDLADWELRDGALVMRATGDDPFLGSPEFDLPSLAIGDIEITMRVHAAQPQFEGEVFWLTADQSDFSPAFKQSFIGQADGAWRTYRVDIASSRMLLLGSRVTRLRLDPVAMPAEIALESIRVYTPCATNDASRCTCAR